MALSADQQTRIAYILQKGKTLEKQIANLKTYMGSSPVDPITAQLRLTNVTILFKDYVRYNEELESLQSDHPHLETFTDTESRYYEVATAVTKLQKLEPIANSTLNATNFTITERHELPKLPEIKLPTFDGNRVEWLAYKNRFVALVHSRTDLSNYVKHTQLLNSLTGSAKAKIVEFDPSEEDYPKAWQALNDSYDHKRIVVVEHLNAILDLPVLSSATADNLSMLLDKARQHLHMLERLEAKPSDEIVVRIIERCLPQATRNRWQDKLELDSLPKLDELLKFIQSTIFKLHALDSAASSSRNSNSAKKRTGEKLSQAHSKLQRVDARSFITTTSTSANNSCPQCNENHRLFKCPVFNKLKVQERWDFVKTNKFCRNCLYAHPLPCKSEKRCKKCERDHHTLLHSEKKGKSPKAEPFQNGAVAPTSITPQL